MKQIVDKLNKIAKKIDESVEIPQTDLIIDSLDAITKAYGGTPNDSNLIVDKLEDIYNNIGSAVSGNIEITENTAEGEPLDISQYATATVNVAGGGDGIYTAAVKIVNNTGSSQAIMEPHIDDIVPANVIKGTAIEIPDQGEYILNIPISQNEMGGVYSYGGSLHLVQGYEVIASDAVNCTFNYVAFLQVYSIDITDINEPSSITLTMRQGVN